MKETYSYLRSKFTRRTANTMSFSLPDGSTIEYVPLSAEDQKMPIDGLLRILKDVFVILWSHRLDDSLVAESAEVLFDAPERSIAQNALQSLGLCDSYARDTVAPNIVVSGGTSMIPGRVAK